VAQTNSVIFIDSALQAKKAARGTKRICQSCEVRFYDLARDPIICPACGAHNSAILPPVLTLGARGEVAGGKTAWRSKPYKQPKPALPAEVDPAPDIAAEPAEGAPGPSADQDLVLEQETDEGDVTDWVDRDAVETKDS
jgi:uncharacterized protein (TIGR02300 family)